jgi:molybdopterin molybdotransferase
VTTPSGDRLLTVEEARAAVFAATPAFTDIEVAYLSEARGRVAAEPVTSPIALPPWDNSAMDGYAIRADDVAGAGEEAPRTLRVIGEVRAGQAPDLAVEHGTAIRIATGAPVPPRDASGAPAGPRGRDATGPLPASIAVHQTVPAGGSIRTRGGDLVAGTTIVEPGTVLTPAVIGLAAGVGLDQVRVHRRPRVGIMATGD